MSISQSCLDLVLSPFIFLWKTYFVNFRFYSLERKLLKLWSLATNIHFKAYILSTMQWYENNKTRPCLPLCCMAVRMVLRKSIKYMSFPTQAKNPTTSFFHSIEMFGLLKWRKWWLSTCVWKQEMVVTIRSA